MLGRIILTLMVLAGFPANNLRDLIDYARANPGKVNVGAGNSVSVLVTAQLSKLAGIEVVTVSYKGDAPAAVC